eukprot:COSAG01_NODE_3870_length_5605_cov_4.345260_9_plen_166_part_00
MVWVLAGLDVMTGSSQGGLDIAAYHYGKLSLAVKGWDMSVKCMDKLLLQPNQNMEATPKLNLGCCGWTLLVLDLKLPLSSYRSGLEKLGFTISTADATVDALIPFSVLKIRPRGETTEGYTMSAEHWGWMAKTSIALVSDNTDDINQLCDEIPSFDDYLPIAFAR